MFLTIINDGNLNDDLNSGHKLCDLDIAELPLECNLEIGTQFPDYENAQRNLKMA